MIDLFQEWAIAPKLSAYARFAQTQLQKGAGILAMGGEEPPAEIEQAPKSGVMILNISGILTKGGEKCTVSMRRIKEYLQEAEALKMPVVLCMDSPGGTVSGLRPLAYYIANMSVPVVSYIDGKCASACYWLAAQTDHIIANDLEENQIGSIGVFTAHKDYSQANERQGIKVTYIYAGKNKIEGNEDSPLSPEVLEEIQSSVNATYQDFLNAIALRNIKEEAKEGKIYRNQKALEMGLIDELGSIETAINHCRKLAIISNF